MENSCHRFVVGNTFWITAFYDTFHYIRHNNLLLFHDFIVADDVQLNIRSNYGKAADFFVAEKAVGNLDYAFLAQFLTR